MVSNYCDCCIWPENRVDTDLPIFYYFLTHKKPLKTRRWPYLNSATCKIYIPFSMVRFKEFIYDFSCARLLEWRQSETLLCTAAGEVGSFGSLGRAPAWTGTNDGSVSTIIRLSNSKEGTSCHPCWLLPCNTGLLPCISWPSKGIISCFADESSQRTRIDCAKGHCTMISIYLVLFLKCSQIQM